MLDNKYSLFRQDRHGDLCNAAVGGGLLIGVRSNLRCSLLSVPVSQLFEILCVRVVSSSANLVIALLYIKPGSSLEGYEALCSTIEWISNQCESTDEFILMGDFNLPSLEWSPSDDELFLMATNSKSISEVTLLDTLSSCHMFQVNHCCNIRQRLLDLVYTSCCSSTEVTGCDIPLLKEDVHHPSLQIIFDTTNYVPSDTKFSNESFHFRRADFELLNKFFAEVDWPALLYDNTNIDTAVDHFYKIINEGFIKFIPRNRVKVKSVKSPTWYDDVIRTLRNKRNAAWKKYNLTKLSCDYTVYSNLRREFNQYSKHLYNLYLERMRVAIKSDPREFWSFVNDKKKSSQYPSTFVNDDQASDNPCDIANMFALFFSKSFSDNNCDIDVEYFKYLSSLPQVNLTSFALNSCDVNVSILKNFDEDYSDSPDGVPAALILKCCNNLVEPLTFLFNLSLLTGIFPAFWKLSFIIPVHKKGNKSLINNYRPIAKLAPIPKLFESLVFEVLMFNCKSVLSPLQHGFLKSRSTSSQLVEFTSYCINSMENGQQIDCIYTDFSKAFDKVQHNILIFKLKQLGFNQLLLSWISSYLSNRFFRVAFNCELSDRHQILSGVPQGSHLGPLLFVIFINDVLSLLPNSCVLAYADDLKIFKTIQANVDGLLLQSDIDFFSKWCVYNGLVLNIDKCTCISFGRKKHMLVHDYKINNVSINRSTHVVDLGVILDTRLDFQLHINRTINRANTMLGFVKRFSKEFNDPYLLKTLFCSLVRPILEYACVVWTPFYDSHVKRIEAVQRRFLRFALRFLPWVNRLILPPYSERLKLLDMVTLETRRKNLGIVFFSRILSGEIDAPNLLRKININVRPRNIRDPKFIYVNCHRTNYGRNEPMSAMSTHFNNSVEDFDFHISSRKFKFLLKNNNN